MDRERVLERIEQSDRKTLEEWKKHVLRCRAFFVRDRNQFEVEECDFLLKHIERRLRDLEEWGSARGP